jgi:plasmid stabilization system protein ParE
MKLRLTLRATRDLTSIADFVHARHPSGALRVRTAILRAFQTLTLFPNAGRAQTVKGVRKLVVPSYPYLIYYLVDTDREEVVVVAVQHAAQEREYEEA